MKQFAKGRNYTFDDNDYDLEVLAMPYSVDSDGQFYHTNTDVWESVTPSVYGHGTFLGFDGEVLGKSWFSYEDEILGRFYKIKFDTDVLNEKAINFLKESARLGMLKVSASSLLGAELKVGENGSIDTFTLGEISIIDKRITPKLEPANKDAVAFAKAVQRFQKAKIEIPNFFKEQIMLENLKKLFMSGKSTYTAKEILSAIESDETPTQITKGNVTLDVVELRDTVSALLDEKLKAYADSQKVEFDKLKATSEETAKIQKAKIYADDINTFLSGQLNIRLDAEQVDAYRKQFDALAEVPNNEAVLGIIKTQILATPLLSERSVGGTSVILGNGATFTQAENAQVVETQILGLLKSMATSEGAENLNKVVEKRIEELSKLATTNGGAS
jgi:hypothetical protein